MAVAAPMAVKVYRNEANHLHKGSVKTLTYNIQQTYKHVARIEEINNATGWATLNYEVLGSHAIGK